tara:strand:+ start:679 stop:2001 length:1323 start_codon:yes stop_codon:yes gene_type:complete
MDRIPKTLIHERIDSLPISLKEPLFSVGTGGVVHEISEEQHFSSHHIDVLMILVGRVLYGFLHPSDFEKELERELGIDTKIVHVISEEIKKKIFAPINAEIIKNYRPLTPEEISSAKKKEKEVKKTPVPIKAEKKKTAAAPKDTVKKKKIAINPVLLGLQKGGAPQPAKKTTDTKTPVPAGATASKLPAEKQAGTPSQASGEAKDDKPFVLFDQKPKEEAPKKKRKGFSLPFGFFGKKDDSAPEPALAKASASKPVKAEVQSAGSAPSAPPPAKGKQSSGLGILGKIKERPERVVHYSGERTQVTPFAQEEDIFQVKDSKAPATANNSGNTAPKPTSPKASVPVASPKTSEQTSLAQSSKDKPVPDVKNPFEESFSLAKKQDGQKSSTDTPSKATRPSIEKPAAEGEVQIKKSSFSFPSGSKNAKKDGKPKVDGNVVHLK